MVLGRVGVWKSSVMYDLSMNEKFKPFLADAKTWNKLSDNALRGEAQAESILLDQMLHRVVQYCPVYTQQEILPTASKKKTKESPDSPPPDDNLPNLKFYPEEDETPEELRNVRIDFNMIARRNLPDTSQEMCHDDIVSALHAVSHIRLDREHITHIDNLEMLGTKVTHLYLQQNHVRHPENLECLVNLQFLTLSGNQITRVENLSCLDQLKFLDLSDNQIQELDVEELPKSLMILSLEGNPCTSMDGYRATVLAALSNLCQLDGVLLGDEDDEESESDDDEGGTDDGTRVRPGGGGGGPDLGDSYYPRRSLEEYFEGASIERTDVFDDVMTSLRDRSKLRQAEMDDQHSAHNEILRKIREDAKT